MPIPSIDTLGIPSSYFSIRGEVIYQSRETREIFVKIRQAPKKKTEEERYFKIRLVGDLAQKLVGNFWDFDVVRVDNDLEIRSGQYVAPLRAKLPHKGGSRPPSDAGGAKPFKKPWEGDDDRAIAPRSDVDRPKPAAPVKRSLPPKLDLPDN